MISFTSVTELLGSVNSVIMLTPFLPSRCASGGSGGSGSSSRSRSNATQRRSIEPMGVSGIYIVTRWLVDGANSTGAYFLDDRDRHCSDRKHTPQLQRPITSARTSYRKKAEAAGGSHPQSKKAC